MINPEDVFTRAFMEALEAKLKAGHRHKQVLPGRQMILLYWEPRAVRERTFENYYSTVVRHKFVVETTGDPNVAEFDELAPAMAHFAEIVKQHATEIALKALGLEK